MKTISILVNITFDSDISDDSLIKEVATNVLDGLVHEVNEVGITPNDLDNEVTDIEIVEIFTNTELNFKFK